jgi:hypothetical protein
MKSNVSAGILLLLGAAGLISIGVTGKGKQILDILFNRTATTGTGNSEGSNPMTDPDAEIKSDSTGDPDWNFPGISPTALFVPGTYVGMKGAAKV